ncbi:adenosylcobinamide-phosphate synthase CbiB [Magnetovibrio sp.]|uniref:adenosylcobinamide-phosphate synthase CbiB n=1 Tax=Magnetovibrio sp. TaxID=2024836 RepID=UPI002F933E85
MFSFGILNANSAFDPFFLLVLALVLDAAVGGMGPVFKLIPHPVVVIGRVIGWFDDRLNRANRSQVDRSARGALVVVIVVALAGAVGWGVQWLTFHHDFGWAVELFLLVALLAQRELYAAVRKVWAALHHGGIEDGRRAVAEIVGRDPAQLDEHGVSRAAIESLAENFSDGVIAPVFWYVLFGFPGLLVYKAVNTLDSMIGYKNERYHAFGFTAAKLDDVLNLIPARLAGLILVLAAFAAPKGNPARAFKTMWRDAAKHNSPNAGWPEAATAGALGLALAGPRKYPHHTVDAAWIGDGTAKATARDIERALYLYVVACLINVLIVAVIAVYRFGVGT